MTGERHHHIIMIILDPRTCQIGPVQKDPPPTPPPLGCTTTEEGKAPRSGVGDGEI